MNSELTTIPLSTSWAIPADSERARSLDRAVRGDYVRSVTHLLEVARARNFCSLPERWDPGRSWRSQIRLPPGGFLVYADLVQAFFRGDAEAAERLFLELAELRPVPIESPIVALDDAELVPHRERYERFMGFGDAGLEGVSPPPGEDSE